MKQVAGLPNSAAGTRITAVALPGAQSRISGVAATEQIRTRAVSIVGSIRRPERIGIAQAHKMPHVATVRCDRDHTFHEFPATHA
jgi:hypothetical protein